MWGITALCAVYVSFAMPIAMLGVAWPEIRDALGRNSGELGVLVAGYGLGRLSTAGSSGVLLRRLPFARAVLMSAVALAAATAWFAGRPAWPLLIVAVIAVGMASGALESLGSRFMAVSASARSAGLLAGSYGVGATIGPAIVAFSGRWQAAYVVSGAITLLAGMAFLAPSLRWPGELATAGAAGGHQVGAGPRPPWTIVLVSLSLFGVFIGMEATAGQWTATFLEQARGVDHRLAGIAVSGFFAGTTLGRIALGAVDVPHRVPLLVVSMPVPLFVAVAVAPSAMVPVLMVLAGLALAPTFPTLMAATAERVGVDRAGQMSGWQMLASNAGATIFPAMTGLVVSLTSPAAPIVVLACMAGLGALLVLIAQRGRAPTGCRAPVIPDARHPGQPMAHPGRLATAPTGRAARVRRLRGWWRGQGRRRWIPHDDTDMSTTVELDGGRRVAYELVGRSWVWRPWVVLISGVGHDRSFWEPLLPRLRRVARVVLVDNHGVGRSDPLRSRVTVGRLAEDIIGVLNDAGLSRVHVVGVSLGGMIAQELAIEHPERVRRLVLASTTPGWTEGYSFPLANAIHLWRQILQPGRASRRSGVRYVLSPRTRRGKPELVERLVREEVLPRPDPRSGILQAAAGSSYSNRGRDRQITAPTLVMHGTDDNVVDPRNAELLANNIPKARLVWVPDAGHLIVWERPVFCARQLVRFLRPARPGAVVAAVWRWLRARGGR